METELIVIPRGGAYYIRAQEQTPIEILYGGDGIAVVGFGARGAILGLHSGAPRAAGEPGDRYIEESLRRWAREDAAGIAGA